jgi:hypothetical protein
MRLGEKLESYVSETTWAERFAGGSVAVGIDGAGVCVAAAERVDVPTGVRGRVGGVGWGGRILGVPGDGALSGGAVGVGGGRVSQVVE